MISLERTEKLMKEKLANKEFDSYAVCVGKNGDETKIFSGNVNGDTFFDIASMGKVLVTATLLLKAMGNDKLTPNDTLDMFFDNVPEEERKITVKQMMTHTSGIIRHEFPMSVADKGREAVKDFILGFPLGFAPGSSQRYSCNAYILLGFIAEKLYGMRLDEAYNKYIKEPLGYTRSGFNIAVDEKNAAVSYKRRDAGEYRVDDENAYSLRGIGGNGAQFFTPDDLCIFVQAVMQKSGKLYPKEIFDLAERDCTGGVGEPWGLGWLIVDENYPQTGKLFPPGSFGHCGHTGTSMFMNRNKGLYAVVLTNATRFLNMRSDFKGYDYGRIMKMREEIHNALSDDLYGSQM